MVSAGGKGWCNNPAQIERLLPLGEQSVSLPNSIFWKPLVEATLRHLKFVYRGPASCSPSCETIQGFDHNNDRQAVIDEPKRSRFATKC